MQCRDDIHAGVVAGHPEEHQGVGLLHATMVNRVRRPVARAPGARRHPGAYIRASMTIYHLGAARAPRELPATPPYHEFKGIAVEEGEKRTCEDVFAALVRLIDANDLSYRD